MSFTIDDARRYLLALLPPGHDEFYDESPTGDVFLIFDAAGQLFKQNAFDLLDTLRTEIFPPSAVQKTPDWEAALGIANQAPALLGTMAQRQQAVVAKLRESGPFCDPVVQSIIGPLLGYFPSTPVQLLKASRSFLTLAHSYGFIGDLRIAAGTTATVAMLVNDGGHVARMGAQLQLVTDTSTPNIQVTLTAPDRRSVGWSDAYQSVPLWLAAPSLAGAAIGGNWTLAITNHGSAPITVYDGECLFVEGIGPNEDTGGAIFHWGVYADPAHVGESGVPPDFPSVLAAIARIKHSHTVGWLIQSLAPYPDVTSGPHAAIPDRCVPV
jgi:hypothetical protein